MADQTMVQSSSLIDTDALPQPRRVRLAISKRLRWLPRFFKPGLIREALYLSAAMKNRYECVRGLYFRDRAPMQVEFRNGARLESSRRDSLFFLVEEIVAARCYTPRWFYKPGPEDVVVDVGANIGVFVTHICNLSASARVACFEPDPWSYGRLAHNVAVNNLAHRVEVHQTAVWREEGVVYLGLSSNDKSVGQRTVAHADGAATPVKCVSLAQALDLADPTGGPIALLKIDAEGAETDILEAAGPAAMRRVQRVALEYHSAEKRIKCNELLKGYGFSVRLGMGNADEGIYLASRTVGGADAQPSWPRRQNS